MHARTTWVLLVLISALGGWGYWLTRADDEAQEAFHRNLLEGYKSASVTSFRIENLKRDHRVVVERGGRGWRIVDPIDYVAEAGAVNRLLDDLATAPAIEVPEAQPETVGLDPPVAILEVFTQADTIEPRWRVEVGLPALNENVVYVRMDGQIWRTLRNLETAVDRPLYEWRNRRAVPYPIAYSAVAEIEREGSEPFRALLDADGWKMTDPHRATLDPGRATTFVRGLLTSLYVMRFLAEDPDGRQRFGLDEPTTTVRFKTATGETTELFFKRAGSSWYCSHDGEPTVVEIDGFAAELFQVPLSELYDARILRLAHDDVQRLELVSQQGNVVLEREGKGFVVSGPAESGAVLERVPADGGRVGDLLTRWTQVELQGLQPLLEGTSPASSAGDRAIWIEGRSGVRFGGTLGTTSVQGGQRGVWFQRPGDEVRGLLASDVAELTSTFADAFVSRVLHAVAEEETVSIGLTQGARERRWVRDDVGRWRLDGSPDPDPDFELVVDRLRQVRAQDFLSDDAVLSDPIRVHLQPRAGQAISFQVGYMAQAGPGADGATARVAYVDHERAAVVDDDLVAALQPFLEE